jgi:ubiquinone/menaquinone biosynthesis C-methylase UbiE
VHLACCRRSIARLRQEVVPQAYGRVLEIGVGSGLNLPFYDSRRVNGLWALDPSVELQALAADRARCVGFPIEFLSAPAESIPLDKESVDTIVITYSLCTIPDVPAALAEMHRVLRRSGQLLFCEHGAAPDDKVRHWQRRLDPLWTRLSGGCRLGRDIPLLLERGGFQVQKLNSKYLSGWRPASFNYWGLATPSGGA